MAVPRRRPEPRVRLAFETFAGEYTIYGIVTEPGALPFASAMAWLAAWPELLGGILFFVFLPLYFPEGRLVSPRWRPVARLAVVALLPGKVRYNSEIVNPLGIEALRPVRDPSETVGLALFMAFILVSLASLVVRFRRSRGEERQQLKWFTYAVSVVLVWFLVNWPIEDAIPDLFPVLDSLVISGVPVAAGIAILRYRLYDIDLLINRTLVYGALTACVVGVYVLIVGYLGALFQTSENLLISLVATGLVAVLFQPLRERLQRTVNHLMYGERDDPYAVLSHLGQRLEATLKPGAVLPAIVETVAQALKLPYVAIALQESDEHDDFTVAAAWGSPVDSPLRLPLVYQHETVGQFLLAPRMGEEDFSVADRRC